MRESQIEKKVTEYAKSQGWLSFKWSSPSQRGVPDRMFFKDFKIKMIEFKTKGKKPTRLQEKVHSNLYEQGFFVDVVDSIEAGKKVFDEA